MTENEIEIIHNDSELGRPPHTRIKSILANIFGAGPNDHWDDGSNDNKEWTNVEGIAELRDEIML